MKARDELRSIGLDSPSVRYTNDDRALIIGAGLAGSAIAGVLAARGMQCTVFDSKHAQAQGTSSVPVAVFKPSHSRKPSIEQCFTDRCFERLIDELTRLEFDCVTRGVHQLLAKPSKHIHSNHWQASELNNRPSLYCNTGGALNPASLCMRWVSSDNVTCRYNAEIDAIRHSNQQWTVENQQGNPLGHGNVLIIANAMQAHRFVPELTLTPVGGQISLFDTPTMCSVICDEGYVVPTKEGIWSGATFHRNRTFETPNNKDEVVNRHRLEQLSGYKPAEHLKSWCGVRCTTTDRLPVVGPVPEWTFYHHAYHDLHLGNRRKKYPAASYTDGLYVFTGLGSRGVMQSLFSAECLADIIMGEGRIDETFLRAIHPARFLMRRLRQTPAKR